MRIYKIKNSKGTFSRIFKYEDFFYYFFRERQGRNLILLRNFFIVLKDFFQGLLGAINMDFKEHLKDLQIYFPGLSIP